MLYIIFFHRYVNFILLEVTGNKLPEVTGNKRYLLLVGKGIPCGRSS